MIKNVRDEQVWNGSSGLFVLGVIWIISKSRIWFYFFQIESIFSPSITCRHVSLLLWQKIKFLALTLLVEPVYFLTITSFVIIRNICFARLKYLLDILCPSRSALRHHRAKSSTQCPLDFIKKHQAVSWRTSYRLTFPETTAAAMFVGRYIKTEGDMKESSRGRGPLTHGAVTTNSSLFSFICSFWQL